MPFALRQPPNRDPSSPFGTKPGKKFTFTEHACASPPGRNYLLSDDELNDLALEGIERQEQIDNGTIQPDMQQIYAALNADMPNELHFALASVPRSPHILAMTLPISLTSCGHVDEAQASLLHYAIARRFDGHYDHGQGWPHVFLTLMQHWGDSLKNVTDTQGRTPLHYAAIFDHGLAAFSLLHAGALIAHDKNGQRFTDVLVAHRHFKILQALIESGNARVLDAFNTPDGRGIDPRWRLPRSLRNRLDKAGRAAIGGCPEPQGVIAQHSNGQTHYSLFNRRGSSQVGLQVARLNEPDRAMVGQRGRGLGT